MAWYLTREMVWIFRCVMAMVFVGIGVAFSSEKSNDHQSKYLKLCHLLSNSIAWGASLWVTFFANIIMYKNLTRHEFGNLQSNMVPTFFLTLAVCCATSIVAFGYVHHLWMSAPTSDKYQLGFLILAFTLCMVNRFYFAPATTKLMKQKYKMERKLNIGNEVGWSTNVVEAPKLASMNNKFWVTHGLSNLSHMLAFGCLTMHTCYLATKIHL